MTAYSDVVGLGADPRDDGEEGLHHAARDQRLAPGLVARQVVQEGEERGGQRRRERVRLRRRRGGERGDAGADQDGQEPVVGGRARHVDNRRQSADDATGAFKVQELSSRLRI